jgi:hypothetical protein
MIAFSSESAAMHKEAVPMSTRNERITTGCAGLIAAVFGLSALDELISQDKFSRTLELHAFFLGRIAPSLAMPLVVVQMGVALGLFQARVRSQAAAVASVLLLAFAAANVANMLLKPAAQPCWYSLTFGAVGLDHALANLALAGVAAYVTIGAQRPPLWR